MEGPDSAPGRVVPDRVPLARNRGGRPQPSRHLQTERGPPSTALPERGGAFSAALSALSLPSTDCGNLSVPGVVYVASYCRCRTKGHR